MHIAEGILPLEQALLWSVLATPWVAWGLQESRTVLNEGSAEQRALLALSGALTFALTLFPLPVPVVGATSHLCATPVLGLLLGPSRVIFPTFLVLLVQALFFAHGGLTTLGANTLTLGVLGPFSALGLLKLCRGLRLPRGLSVGLACGLADVLVYTADAGMVGLVLDNSRSWLQWAGVILLGFAPVQLPLSVLEAGVSAALIHTLEQRRETLLPSYLRVPVGLGLLLGLMLTPFSPGEAFAQSLPELPAPTAAPSAEPSFLGIDETVLAAVASQGGRPARAPLIDLEETELGRALLMLACFLSGWVAHAAWRQLMRAPHATTPASTAAEPSSTLRYSSNPPPEQMRSHAAEP